MRSIARAALALLFIVSASCSGSRQPTPLGVGEGWSLRFADEFTGNSVDWKKWRDTSSAERDDGHGNPDNQQLEWNQAQNCSVKDGRMTITAKPDSITSPSGRHYHWSSCLISSTYNFRYGFIEERAKFPSAAGFWAAFWTWQAPGSDTNSEVDAYESYSDNPRTLHLRHPDSDKECVHRLPFDPTTSFHIYGVDIEPDGIRWYIDGQNVCETSATASGPTNIIDDMFVYSKIPPEPGAVEHKSIDYIRAWQHP